MVRWEALFRHACQLPSARLDRGGGEDLSLPECSREQLEKEASNIFALLIEPTKLSVVRE